MKPGSIFPIRNFRTVIVSLRVFSGTFSRTDVHFRASHLWWRFPLIYIVWLVEGWISELRKISRVMLKEMSLSKEFNRICVDVLFGLQDDD